MARLWSSGFELNSLTTNVEITNIQSTPVLQTSTVRSGTYAAQITSLGSGTVKAISYQFVSAVGTGPYYFRTYFRYATLPTANNAIIRLSTTTTGSTVASVRLTSTGGLALFNGSTQIGSTSSNLTANTWYRVEVHFDRSPAGGSQILELFIDGLSIASSSSLTLSGNILDFAVGGNLQAEAQTTGNWYFDDLAINDSTGATQNSFPGAGNIVYLRPSGAGDSTQWTIGGSSPAATNWQSVSEVTPDDAITFVDQNTSGKSDFYTVTSSPLGPSDTVNVVQIGFRFNNNTADATTSFQLQVEKTSGGTVSKSSNIIANAVVWGTNSSAAAILLNYQFSLYNDPDSSPWTQSTINSMQIGAIIAASGTHNIQITGLWALVEYVPGVSTGYPAGLFAGTQFAYSSFSNAYGSIGSTAVQDTIELLLTGVG